MTDEQKAREVVDAFQMSIMNSKYSVIEGDEIEPLVMAIASALQQVREEALIRSIQIIKAQDYAKKFSSDWQDGYRAAKYDLGRVFNHELAAIRGQTPLPREEET